MRHEHEGPEGTEGGGEDAADGGPLAVQTLQTCLRYLQREAEAAGLIMTAHLIGTASLAALDESVSSRPSRLAP